MGSILAFSSNASAYSLPSQLRRIDLAIQAKKTMILVLNRSHANPVRLEPQFESDIGQAKVEIVYLASEDTELEGEDHPIYIKTKDLNALRFLPTSAFHYVFLPPLSPEEADSPGSYEISCSSRVVYKEIRRVLGEYGHFYRGLGPVEKQSIYEHEKAVAGTPEAQVLWSAFVALRQQLVKQDLFTMDSGFGWSDGITPFPLLGPEGEPIMSYFTFITGSK